MTRTERDIARLMARYGFTLIRGGGSSHFIWGRGDIRVTVSSSPSCNYFLKNVERDIVRAIKRSNDV